MIMVGNVLSDRLLRLLNFAHSVIYKSRMAIGRVLEKENLFMSKKNKKMLQIVITVLFGLLSAPLFADYVEFVDEKISKEKAEKGESPSESGVYLEPGAAFGQSYTTEGDGSPILSYNLGIDAGYFVQTSSWRRLEAGGELFTGKVGYRTTGTHGIKANMVIPMGIMAKLGYGYSLGSKLYGLWKVGVGPVGTNFKADDGDNTLSSKSTLWGFGGKIALMLLMPVSDKFQVTTGLSFTRLTFDIGDLKAEGPYVNGTVKYGKAVNLNVLEARLGMRLVL